jgi:CxxC-x17-CxxC domain-containing protein
MGQFNRESKGKFSGRDFGRSSRRFNSRDSDRRERSPDREMHEVTCDKCGKLCNVPFKPTSSKPVYCSDCFKQNKDSAPRRGSSDSSSEELAIMNTKLDKIMRALKID